MKCTNFVSIKLCVECALLGGFHAAKFLTSSEKMEADKGNVEGFEINVTSFGNFIKMLLDVCPTLEKFTQVSCRNSLLKTTRSLTQ